MRLESLLDSVEVLDLRGDPGVDITGVTYTSSKTEAGSLFCCLPGRARDGHEFARDARDRGAAALLVERLLDLDPPITQVRVADARRAMGLLSSAFHGHPSRALTVVGVTGTNGKSTTSYLVQRIMDGAGRRCGVLGTMNNERTTPEAPDLQAALAGFVAAGDEAAAIEVSSVGLVQRRVDGVWFAAAIFTNLSLDELWIHQSMEEYFQAKASLFDPQRTPLGVVNADDDWGSRLLRERGDDLHMVPFTRRDVSDLRLEVGRSIFRWRGADVHLPLDGEFNVMNAVAAMTACAELGVDADVAAAAVSAIAPIRGHGEPVECGQPFRVVIDFAHTAGALAAVLDAARRATGDGGRVFVVFGCGGDRDPGRREPMGAAAAAHADVVIITSDNPRTEDPRAIVDAVASGASREASARAAEVAVEIDRAEAIERALREAGEGDVVVIAGKGHETGQIIGTTVIPFDDREVAREVLARLGFGSSDR